MSTFDINEYVVNRKRIGKGSFSTIYKGYNKHSKKVFAIKEMSIDKKHNKSNIKRELNVLKKMDNQYIVKLYDVIIDTNYNNIYFVLDYFPNGDLAKFLNHKPLKEKYTRKYMKQLSEGLKYLLNYNILHRDLKPQNILLTEEYNIKITDFGFAKQLQNNVMLTTLCGSPMYMAPEIINKKDYDIKSDLWSVGIIMYEMLYGKVPFKAGNFLELIKNINNTVIMYEHPKIIPSYEALDLLKKLLVKEPNERANWNDFFNHSWFNNDELLSQENNLMELSFNSSKMFSNYKSEKQFCSFIYESMTNKYDSSSLQKSRSMTMPKSYIEKDFSNNSDSDYQKDELQFMESSEEYENNNDSDSEYISANDDSDKEEFDNEISINSETSKEFDNDAQMIQSDIGIEYKPNKYTNIHYNETFKHKSKPIKIKYSKVTNLHESNGFEIINKHDFNGKYKSHSEPKNINYNKTLAESFQEYLNSSINLIRQSYNYISNKSI